MILCFPSVPNQPGQDVTPVSESTHTWELTWGIRDAELPEEGGYYCYMLAIVVCSLVPTRRAQIEGGCRQLLSRGWAAIIPDWAVAGGGLWN